MGIASFVSISRMRRVDQSVGVSLISSDPAAHGSTRDAGMSTSLLQCRLVACPSGRLLYFLSIERRNGDEGEEYPRGIQQGGRVEDCKLSPGDAWGSSLRSRAM